MNNKAELYTTLSTRKVQHLYASHSVTTWQKKINLNRNLSPSAMLIKYIFKNDKGNNVTTIFAKV